MDILENIKPISFHPFTDEPLYSREQIYEIVKNQVNKAVKENTIKLYNDNVVKPRISVKDMQYDELLFFIKLASELSGIKVKRIKSNVRIRPLLRARFIYYILARFYTEFSLTEIGQMVNRDHATVLNSLNTHASKRYSIGGEVEKLIQDKFDSNFDIEEAWRKGKCFQDYIKYE